MKRAVIHHTTRLALLLATITITITITVLAPAAQAGSPAARAMAQAVGIGETELRQFMGWGPLTYAQLRQDPSRTSAKLLRALGPERHAQLVAGEPIQVPVQMDGRPVLLQVQRGH